MKYKNKWITGQRKIKKLKKGKNKMGSDFKENSVSKINKKKFDDNYSKIFGKKEVDSNDNNCKPIASNGSDNSGDILDNNSSSFITNYDTNFSSRLDSVLELMNDSSTFYLVEEDKLTYIEFYCRNKIDIIKKIKRVSPFEAGQEKELRKVLSFIHEVRYGKQS